MWYLTFDVLSLLLARDDSARLPLTAPPTATPAKSSHGTNHLLALVLLFDASFVTSISFANCGLLTLTFMF